MSQDLKTEITCGTVLRGKKILFLVLHVSIFYGKATSPWDSTMTVTTGQDEKASGCTEEL